MKKQPIIEELERRTYIYQLIKETEDILLSKYNKDVLIFSIDDPYDDETLVRYHYDKYSHNILILEPIDTVTAETIAHDIHHMIESGVEIDIFNDANKD